MKKSIYLSALAAAAILSSCSNNDEPTQVFLNGELRVTAAIDQIKTRYSDNAFAANDEIGISGGDYTNVKFATTDGVAFSAAGDKIMIAENAEKVSFTAYAPYSADTNDGTITFTEPTDYLFAAAKEATYSEPKVTFEFKHMMSKISLTLNLGEDVTEKGIKVSLTDVVKGGTFNTTTGAVTPSETKGNVSVESEENTVAIILPPSTEAQDVKLSMTFNEKSFSGTLNIPALTAGYQYNYTITIKEGSTSANAELNMENPSVSNWTTDEKNNGSLEVEEDEDMTTEIGDFLLKDGTVMDKNSPRFNDQKSNIVGVVYHLGTDNNAKEGLAIALNNANELGEVFATKKYNFNTYFSTDGNNTENYILTNLNVSKTDALSNYLGLNNTNAIRTANTNLTSETTGVEKLISYLDNYNSTKGVSGASQWYLPSYAEFSEIMKNYEIVNASITKAGGNLAKYDNFNKTATEDKAQNTVDNFYWTSDLRGSDYTWAHPLIDALSETSNDNPFLGRISTAYKGYFRFAIAF